MGFRVIKGGMMTTVQDTGRFGYQSQGINAGGVMDLKSFKIANILLDNPENEAALEVTMIGPTLEFTSDVIIAITGGDFQPTINGEPVPMYTALYVHKDDILKLGSAISGSRAYIAFSSYLQIPTVMGSRSTNLKSSIGGFKGRKLKDGDYIEFRIRRRYLPFFLSRTLVPEEYDTEAKLLRVIMGPQTDMFTQEGLRTFLSGEYTVTAEFDRMGCRLDGPLIATNHGSDIISDGIAFGAIQVPAHGKPIILLADRQTTGGYAKIATVCSADLPKIAQMRPDQKVRFKRITVEEAQKILLDEVKNLDQIRHTIHKPCKEVLDCRQTAKRLGRLYATADSAVKHF